jgi:ACS family hexuronate transporter-like MFS transporter
VAGIINAGSNMGVIVAALLVPLLTIQFGWQATFIMTGALGFLVVIWMWSYYRTPDQHASVSEEEEKYIQSEQQAVKPIAWRELLNYKALWTFTIMKF